MELHSSILHALCRGAHVLIDAAPHLCAHLLLLLMMMTMMLLLLYRA